MKKTKNQTQLLNLKRKSIRRTLTKAQMTLELLTAEAKLMSR